MGLIYNSANLWLAYSFLFVFLSYGIGSLFTKNLGIKTQINPAVKSAIGLSLFMFYVACLNLFKAVNLISVTPFFLVGAYGLWDTRQSLLLPFKTTYKKNQLSFMFVFLVLSLVIFLKVTNYFRLPFNYNDDFPRYLLYVNEILYYGGMTIDPFDVTKIITSYHGIQYLQSAFYLVFGTRNLIGFGTACTHIVVFQFFAYEMLTRKDIWNNAFIIIFWFSWLYLMPQANLTAHLEPIMFFLTAYVVFLSKIKTNFKYTLIMMLVGGAIVLKQTMLPFAFFMTITFIGFDILQRKISIKNIIYSAIVMIIFLAPFLIFNYRCGDTFLYPLIKGNVLRDLVNIQHLYPLEFFKIIVESVIQKQWHILILTVAVIFSLFKKIAKSSLPSLLPLLVFYILNMFLLAYMIGNDSNNMLFRYIFPYHITMLMFIYIHFSEQGASVDRIGKAFVTAWFIGFVFLNKHAFFTQIRRPYIQIAGVAMEKKPAEEGFRQAMNEVGRKTVLLNSRCAYLLPTLSKGNYYSTGLFYARSSSGFSMNQNSFRKNLEVLKENGMDYLLVEKNNERHDHIVKHLRIPFDMKPLKLKSSESDLIQEYGSHLLINLNKLEY